MIFKRIGMVGLNIGSRYIQAIQLNEGSDGYQLKSFGITMLQPELIVDGSILDNVGGQHD